MLESNITVEKFTASIFRFKYSFIHINVIYELHIYYLMLICDLDISNMFDDTCDFCNGALSTSNDLNKLSFYLYY